MTELPSAWVLCAIGDVLAPVKMTGKDEPDREIWYVDISSIDNQTNRITDPKRLQFSEAPSRARQKIAGGDVLFSTVRPYLRKIAAVESKYDGEIASTGFAVLRGATGIDPKYLLFKAISHDFVSALTGEQYGVSYPAVKEEQVKAQPLELPPTNEQRRIVEKIEAMFDEIAAGIQSLQTARATLGLYRQSLLKSAFEGRLTADWRAQNADNLEAPESLLARIQKERDTRYKAALDVWQDALAAWRADGEKGKKPAKPKRPKDISDLAKSKKSNGFWPTLELGDIVHVSSGNGLTSKDMKKGPYPVYGGNGINGYHDEYFLEEEELLIGRVGAKCGVTHIARPKSWVTDNALIVTPLVTSFDKHFFKRLLETKELNRLGSSTGQPVISGSKIYPVTLELPSIAEQAEIVRILDEKLEAADALEAEIDAALTRADALRQSILKKAFSGQLVPQDTDDEPATALLERIKADRLERSKGSRPKKARTTKRKETANGA
ncbi:restriction endonuclease subunit S [Roseovarius sp.]|uniref:restriction endonuclease subunit S n=1 Tax=Roseovarius sp. TaxID=1486281 RepID=UPI003564CD5A